jgi:ABC-type glutathione transport system ATPase component
MSGTPRRVIEVGDLVKVYGGDTRAVDRVSFDVEKGELFCRAGCRASTTGTPSRSRSRPSGRS